jgi:Transcriptional Coactivator p15 (PC4)
MEPFVKPDASVHVGRRKARTESSASLKPKAKAKPRKMNMQWKTPNKADYNALNAAMIVHCRITHPNPMMSKGRGVEYRLRELPWSEMAYVDIRKYYTRSGNYGKGLMLHYDVWKALLPHLLTLLRDLESRDHRDPQWIRKVDVVGHEDAGPV